jgi:hypothetical protein
MHKNENAKNYFTCNDTSISNLGFVEFTDVYYEVNTLPKIDKEFVTSKDSILIQKLKDKKFYDQWFGADGYFTLSLFMNKNKSVYYYDGDKVKNGSLPSIINKLSSIIDERHIFGLSLQIWYDNRFTFQDYISIKSELLKLKDDRIKIDTNEFI